MVGDWVRHARYMEVTAGDGKAKAAGSGEIAGRRLETEPGFFEQGGNRDRREIGIGRADNLHAIRQAGFCHPKRGGSAGQQEIPGIAGPEKLVCDRDLGAVHGNGPGRHVVGKLMGHRCGGSDGRDEYVIVLEKFRPRDAFAGTVFPGTEPFQVIHDGAPRRDQAQ
jgi:hypothetical protein